MLYPIQAESRMVLTLNGMWLFFVRDAEEADDAPLIFIRDGRATSIVTGNDKYIWFSQAGREWRFGWWGTRAGHPRSTL